MTTGGLSRIRHQLLGAIVFAAALALWEVWARTHASFLVPTASAVGERAWQAWPSGDFALTVAASLKRLAAGYALGSGIGITLGLLMGASTGTRKTLDPLVELARATPAIAVVPAAIVLLGLGDAMRIAVIAFGVCFPVLVSTLDGVRAVPPEARDSASMLQVGPVERMFRLYLPAALPAIVAGLRVALSIGLVVMVISEFVGEGDGLGRYIQLQQSQFNVPEVYGGILFLGLLGCVLNGLLLRAERHVLAWHFGAVGESAR